MFDQAAKIIVIMLAACLVSCGMIGGGTLGRAACPALRPNISALDVGFDANATVNAKVQVFVQAAKDMDAISAQIEMKAAQACQRMGMDLGLSPAQMQPRKGPGGAAAGACEPLAMHIDAILRQGIRVTATVQPPRCQANAQAQAHCAGRCDVNRDAECRASCEAHAEVHASCQPAVVHVQASQGAQQAAALVATLQANLPQLIEAQITLGQRLVHHAQVIAQVGANLPKIVGKAGAQALACIGAAADIAASASVRINVSVKASASVSARAGAG
jgi:hypothetical protein